MTPGFHTPPELIYEYASQIAQLTSLPLQTPAGSHGVNAGSNVVDGHGSALGKSVGGGATRVSKIATGEGDESEEGA